MLPRTPRGQIRRSLDARRWRERDVVYGTVVATANPRAGHWVTLPGSTEPIFVGSTAGGVSFRPGATVPLLIESGEGGYVIAGLPAPARKGAADFPGADPMPGSSDVWGIISATPEVLVVGSDDQDVTVTGYNFVDGDTFRPVVWDEAALDWVVDPDATVHDVVFVDSATVTAQIDVAAGRPSAGRVTLQPLRSWEG